MTDEVILSAEDIPTITAPALAERHARVRGFFAKLSQDPPQVLLLEGGTTEERVSTALYWAALINCTSPQDGTPCLNCDGCVQMLTQNHRDMFFLDGREGNIKIDQVREMRSVLGEPPRGDGKRVVILAEAQSLGIEAANALLKSLEEPRPGTSFLLLTPQRERLLPTLVSRSWALTLAWPQNTAPDAEIEAWSSTLATFITSGKGWFAKTSARGALDNPLCKRLIAKFRSELVSAITKRELSSPLAQALANLSPSSLRTFDEILAEAQDALEYNTNPALVMDWLATKLSLLT